MHVVGIRRDLAERHPWLPVAVYKAMEQAKSKALEHLRDTSATKITLPFVEEQLAAASDLMGDDFFSYGVARNRLTLEAFLRHHSDQGLSNRLLDCRISSTRRPMRRWRSDSVIPILFDLDSNPELWKSGRGKVYQPPGAKLADVCQSQRLDPHPEP